MPIKAIPLTPSQKKFVDENYQSMTCLDMSMELELKSIFKVAEYFREMGYKRKKELTEDQKEFIRNNYLKMTEARIVKKLGITRMLLQNFKREENLFTYPKNRK